ncbi:hypothetical protein SS45_24410 [Enterobacter hormaechei subsp. steigerwaltii]|uniref:DUF551 domain-containing protein n=1 Tax=Enterobacter hormaechei TaxID=158836 RepID=UPI0005EF469F|nr:DUF551 domain-containing protein [Enterobacter hormaechei]KJN36845.1 hypothetical protein SS45_24410 [Enterobacter hormaechei subsp. steigerwaltii]CZZ77320.1 Protein of uncharacterised function (DUF551) [Enterobacter hormaechei]SAA10573.1 Protein of uncharacterised function (DUF551) [Enterobacter hormaechei]SAA89148.1 Protein of uncharacterised function (DUF551) [Enterobacter hormaechei]SAB04338.1 Protein of uncharacterised function (DUF551) [Enterobacter hormaechei]
MSTITKEWLLKTIAELEEERDAVPGAVNEDAAMALAAIKLALASLEAEPIGFAFADDVDLMRKKIKVGGMLTVRHQGEVALYTAPPAPVSVPAAMEMDDDFDSAFEHGKAVGWNAYRAAMLQSFGNSEQLNSPVIQDGWVACVERMPSAGEQVLAYRPDAPESNDPLIKMATYVGGSAHGHGFDCYCKPTHWMPLPAAPQQEA